MPGMPDEQSEVQAGQDSSPIPEELVPAGGGSVPSSAEEGLSPALLQVPEIPLPTSDELVPDGVELADPASADAGLAEGEFTDVEVVDAELVDVADSPEGDAAAGEVLDAELVEDGESTDVGEGLEEGDEGEGFGNDAEDGAFDALDEEVPEQPKRHAPKAATVRKLLLAMVVLFFAASLVATGLFCWQKWLRFDDAADFKGVWKVQATGDTIVFDGRDLKLTRGISYEYELDPNEKTITYRFGELVGGGHYYFGLDHDTLVIVDGDERLGMLAEAGFLPAGLLQEDDASDNKTVLVKVSNNTDATPSGTATGVSAGMGKGEREYVMQPEPEPSSSSSSKKKKSEDSGNENERRGFVDEDGDGYDDETDLEYEDFIEQYQPADEDEDADGEADEEAEEEADEEAEDAEYVDEADEDAEEDANAAEDE